MGKIKKSKLVFSIITMIWPVVIALIFYVYMNFQSIIMSFQTIDFYGKTSFNGLNNFKEFFNLVWGEEPIIGRAIWQAVKYWVIVFCISNPLYVLFGYMVWKGFKGDKIMRGITMLPQVISMMVFTLVFKNFINDVAPTLGMVGLLDGKKAFGTVIFFDIWISFPTMILVLPNAMSKIDPEIIESTKIDGISNIWQELIYIVIPLILPTYTTLIVTGVAGILNGSSSLVTFFMYDAPIETYSFGYYYTIKVMTTGSDMQGWPMLSAGGIIMTCVVVPLVLGVKYFLEKIDPMSSN